MIREWNSSRQREFFVSLPKLGTLKEKDGGARGPIAHPVERIICNDEVSGSSPLGSTEVLTHSAQYAGPGSFPKHVGESKQRHIFRRTYQNFRK